jgi:DNA polymerase-3 subunit alpha
VFQLVGGRLGALVRSMRPDSFEDISAVGALYRPGPMGADSHNKYARRKNGREEVVPIHPELAEPLQDILGETYGLIVYQEQVMAIAQKLAGYSLGQADLLRRAMGKKKKAELDKQFEAFSAGMQERGYSMKAVQTLWDILLPFSDYAFN